MYTQTPSRWGASFMFSLFAMNHTVAACTVSCILFLIRACDGAFTRNTRVFHHHHHHHVSSAYSDTWRYVTYCLIKHQVTVPESRSEGHHKVCCHASPKWNYSNKPHALYFAGRIWRIFKEGEELHNLKMTWPVMNGIGLNPCWDIVKEQWKGVVFAPARIYQLDRDVFELIMWFQHIDHKASLKRIKFLDKEKKHLSTRGCLCGNTSIKQHTPLTREQFINDIYLCLTSYFL